MQFNIAFFILDYLKRMFDTLLFQMNHIKISNMEFSEPSLGTRALTDGQQELSQPSRYSKDQLEGFFLQTILECKECPQRPSKKFATHSAWWLHIRACHKDLKSMADYKNIHGDPDLVKFKHKCRLCNMELVLNMSVVRRHLKVQHQMSLTNYMTIYREELLKERLGRPIIPSKHTLEGWWEGCMYRCAICDQTFPAQIAFENHLSRNHGITGKQEIKEKYVNVWGKLSSLTRAHQCYVCGKVMRHEYTDIHIHLRNHKLDIESYATKYRIQLQKELTDKEMTYVLRRESDAESKISLVNYLAKHNVEGDVTNLMAGWYDCSEYRCGLCDETFWSNLRFHLHIKRQHGLQSTKEYRSVHGDPEVALRQHKCQLCFNLIKWEASSIRKHLKLHKDPSERLSLKEYGERYKDYIIQEVTKIKVASEVSCQDNVNIPDISNAKDMPSVNTACNAMIGETRDTMYTVSQWQELLSKKVSPGDRVECNVCKRILNRHSLTRHQERAHTDIMWLAGKSPVIEGKEVCKEEIDLMDPLDLNRSLSAFFQFSQEQRPVVSAELGNISKTEIGNEFEIGCAVLDKEVKSKQENMAVQAKAKYEDEMRTNQPSQEFLEERAEPNRKTDHKTNKGTSKYFSFVKQKLEHASNYGSGNYIDESLLEYDNMESDTGPLNGLIIEIDIPEKRPEEQGVVKCCKDFTVSLGEAKFIRLKEGEDVQEQELEEEMQQSEDETDNGLEGGQLRKVRHQVSPEVVIGEEVQREEQLSLEKFKVMHQSELPDSSGLVTEYLGLREREQIDLEDGGDLDEHIVHDAGQDTMFLGKDQLFSAREEGFDQKAIRVTKDMNWEDIIKTPSSKQRSPHVENLTKVKRLWAEIGGSDQEYHKKNVSKPKIEVTGKSSKGTAIGKWTKMPADRVRVAHSKVIMPRVRHSKNVGIEIKKSVGIDPPLADISSPLVYIGEDGILSKDVGCQVVPNRVNGVLSNSEEERRQVDRIKQFLACGGVLNKTCPGCGKVMSRQRNLVSHLKVLHDIKVHCSLGEENMSRYSRENMKVQCDICKKSISKKSIKRHVRLNHTTKVKNN